MRRNDKAKTLKREKQEPPLDTSDLLIQNALLRSDTWNPVGNNESESAAREGQTRLLVLTYSQPGVCMGTEWAFPDASHYPLAQLVEANRVRIKDISFLCMTQE